MDYEAAQAKQLGYFSELNISTNRHHQESFSGQMMSSSEESFTMQTIKEINFNREVEPHEKKENILNAV